MDAGSQELLSPPTTTNKQIRFVEGGSGGHLATVKSPPAGNLGEFNELNKAKFTGGGCTLYRQVKGGREG